MKVYIACEITGTRGGIVGEITKEDLKQIYYTNKEIAMWRKELENLRWESLVKSPSLSDMPKGGCKRGMEDYAISIVECETIITKLLTELQAQRKRAMEYINSLDDSLIRQIIFYRCVLCMNWNNVAKEIGGGNNEESVKKRYYRFFKKKDVPICPEGL